MGPGFKPSGPAPGYTLETTEEKPPCLNSWAPRSYSDSAHDPEDQPGLQIANEVGGSQTTYGVLVGIQIPGPQKF